jgi:aspartyl/asparaginyl-tRNA synthetase
MCVCVYVYLHVHAPFPTPLSSLHPSAPQAVELKASRVVHLGACDAATYPMAKKKQSMEFLRDKAHLRPRTNTIGAVARIRNALAFATHSFFQEAGFYYVHTPIITASDCEGAGEMFQARCSVVAVYANGAVLCIYPRDPLDST